jgi:hypothetical protein
MITVKFAIPEMTGNFTSMTPKLYLWFAYFWGDLNTFMTSQKIRVSVPPSSDIRDAYSDNVDSLPSQLAIPIPPEFGTFQVNLDDFNFTAAAGVLVLLFGQHDTPDSAISAGYAAFGPAVSQQLNTYVTENGVITLPTPSQLDELANGIKNSVKSAISSSLGDLDKFLTLIGQETQDESIGYSYAFFAPGTLRTHENLPIPLLPIANQYQFPFATLTVEATTGIDPCTALAQAVQQAMANVTALTTQVHQLQTEYATTAGKAERAALKFSINQILKQRLPAAQTALTNALNALQNCRAITEVPITGPVRSTGSVS